MFYFKLFLFILNLFLFEHILCTTVPWYETLPAVAMDYKVHIDAGKEDCYFQFVNPSATFYVSFQVLRGGDGMAGFAVRNPKGELVHPYQWQAQTEYQEQAVEGGYYSVCIDNQFSRFAPKLVNLYITVIRYDKWDDFNKDIEEMNLNVANFTNVIKNVERNINDILQYQHRSRSKENRDYILLSDNNKYIMRWTLTQIFCIIVISVIQVVCVRQLFAIKNVKPRP